MRLSGKSVSMTSNSKAKLLTAEVGVARLKTMFLTWDHQN